MCQLSTLQHADVIAYMFYIGVVSVLYNLVRLPGSIAYLALQQIIGASSAFPHSKSAPLSSISCRPASCNITWDSATRP